MLNKAPLVYLCLLLAGCSNQKPVADSEPLSSTAFRSFVDDYFKQSFDFSPSSGTAQGFHEYDDKLESLSADAIRNRVTALRSLQARLQALRKQNLTTDESIDAALIEGQINSELQDHTIIESWKRNPMNYAGLPGGAIDLLMKRDFASKPERLRSVIARLRRTPDILAEMKQNMVTPPVEFTDLAIRMSGGSVEFFRDTVAAWAKDAAGEDKTLLQDFQSANKDAVAAFEDATKWLETTLKPRSTGRYAIGADNFAQKLQYEEMVDTPVSKLLAIGQANLEKDYRDFIQTAKKIDPNRKPADVFRSLENDHPAEATLISSARNTVDAVRQFVVDHKIVTIPSDVRPSIEETPPYARSGTFASMDTPGAFEKKAREAFYYITPPEKDWTPKHKEEHLRLYNRPVMDVITVHEAYPGHFVQFLYARQFPTKTRKLVTCGSNAEGWAHYCEQMMLEEGFGGGDPKIKLAQLSEALLRDCRYVVGIKLHTEGMSVKDGAKIFVEKGFQEPANAYEEARRGAYNPTYLYYTLGKLQIYKLRHDYQQAKGSGFSLEAFHNEFVKQGAVPLKVIRKILLPNDTGSTL